MSLRATPRRSASCSSRVGLLVAGVATFVRCARSCSTASTSSSTTPGCRSDRARPRPTPPAVDATPARHRPSRCRPAPYAEIRDRRVDAGSASTYSRAARTAAARAARPRCRIAAPPASREPFTVGAVDGGGDYRVLAESRSPAAARSSSRSRSTDVDETLGTLRLVELAVLRRARRARRRSAGGSSARAAAARTHRARPPRRDRRGRPSPPVEPPTRRPRWAGSASR